MRARFSLLNKYVADAEGDRDDEADAGEDKANRTHLIDRKAFENRCRFGEEGARIKNVKRNLRIQNIW